MTKQEFFDLLGKYEKGTCTEQEKIIFDDFYHEFDKQPGRWVDWDVSAKEQIRLDIYTKMRQRAGVPVLHQKFRPTTGWRIAASIIILLSIGYLVFNHFDRTPDIQYLTRTTGRGQRTTVTLNDGSVVQLNSESSVTFPEKFEGKSRTVTLTGEAFFEVAKDPDKPFLIQSGDLTTTVLGTSFNIQAYPENDHMEVTVATGKVCVETSSGHTGSNEDKDRSILTPNQQAFYNKTSKTLEKRDVDLHQYAAWKEGVIVLNGVSLEEAAGILERWYHVEFNFENESVKHYIINGEFRNDTIINILENIRFLTGIEYQVQPDNRIILKNQSRN